MIWLFTIKHTATHYAMEHLRNMSLEQAILNVTTGEVTSPGDWIHLHIEEPGHRPLERYDGGKCVVNMRNPVDAFGSWYSRYFFPRSRIDGIQPALDVELSYLKAMEFFDEVIEKINPYIFRVDAENIKAEVEFLADYLEIQDYVYKYVDPDNFHGTERKHDLEPIVPDSVIELSYKYGYKPPMRIESCRS